MRSTRHRKRVATTLAVTAALAVAVGPRGLALAHDATETPPRSPEDSQHAPQHAPQPPLVGAASAGTAAGSATPRPAPLASPLMVFGAGAVTAGLGGWVLYDETHRKTGVCTDGPASHASCTSPSVGPGLGLAMVVVGAQVALGGIIWLGVRWHGRAAPVALQVGPGTLALHATF